MDKNTLRKTYLEKRKTLSKAEYQRRNTAIATQFFEQFDLKDINTLHTFLPIEKTWEVNTWHIINEIRQDFQHVKIAVPKTVGNDLQHFELKENTVLRENNWGIPEPVDAAEVPVSEIDLVLVPLISFDKKGNRIGYGKGFYDRFLAQCRPDTLKIGLSLAPPLDFIPYTNKWDVRLDGFVSTF